MHKGSICINLRGSVGVSCNTWVIADIIGTEMERIGDIIGTISFHLTIA
jgi:hypothetical protein